MYVKCIGSGDAFGSGGRFNTSFYIRANSSGMLLDCGASTLTGLKRENLSADDVDVILISHLHGDHFGGLAFILCEILALRKRRKTLTIVGPERTESRALQSLECFYPGVEFTNDAPIRFIHYRTGETQRLGDLQFTPYKALHSPTTNPHALRIETASHVIAYSGDTAWTDELVKASEGADLFICEASGYQGLMKNHLTVEQVLQKLHKLRAKKIVLTHPGEEVLRHLGEIELHVAQDGEVLLDNP